MYTLTNQQIDFIDNDIRARGVTTEDLQLNLLDHICCIIENEFDENGNFEQFYSNTINSFFKKELRELEDETQLLLTFKHYYTMKKITFISGFTSASLLLIGAFFKVMHWPLSNFLLIIGVGLFFLLFLPLMFTLRLKEKTETREKAVLILGLFVSIFLLIGALFKMMHWPGTGIFMLLGFPLLLFVFLPVYLFTGLRNPATKVNVIITTILILAGCAFLLVLPVRNNVYNVRAQHVFLKNEELSLTRLQALVQLDSANQTVNTAYQEFMANANNLKNAITKMSIGTDYNVYLEYTNWNASETEKITPTLIREFPETEKYITSLVKLENSMNRKVYLFEKNMGFDAPNRNSEMDFVLISNLNVKDLLGTIVNTQLQASLALTK